MRTNATTTPTPPGQAEFRGATAVAWLQLIRAPNLFTAAADVAMGYLFTHAAMLPGQWAELVLLAGVSGLLYASGVVLNDVEDVEIDGRQRPSRPLPSGRISSAAARRLGWQLWVAGIAAAWLAAWLANDVRPGVFALLLAGCVVLYNGVAKNTVFGPVVMGACRMLNVLMGMSLVAGPDGLPRLMRPEHWLVAAAIGLYVVGVTCFARSESRTTHPLRLLPAAVIILSGVALLLPLPRLTENKISVLAHQPDRWPLLIGLLAALLGLRCLRAVLNPVPEQIQAAVKHCLLSIIILDAAVCFVVWGSAGALIILALLVPALLLGFWIPST